MANDELIKTKINAEPNTFAFVIIDLQYETASKKELIVVSSDLISSHLLATCESV